jgi:hypothetical protein
MPDENLEEATKNATTESERNMTAKGALNFLEYEFRGRANQGVIHNCWTGREIKYRN